MKEKTLKYLKLRLEFLATEAVRLKSKLDTSKTQLKKDYYSKKLKKNNEQALDILMLLSMDNTETV